MLQTKNPPKVHTQFIRTEIFIETLADKGITTAWSFMDPHKESPHGWLIRGSATIDRIDLVFHPFLFDPELPEPYHSGDEIDIATVSILAHEAGHVFDQSIAKYASAKIQPDKFHSESKENKVLILDVEKQAWRIGEFLLTTCCLASEEFDRDFKWDLFHDIQHFCLNTYKKGLSL